MRAVSLCNSGGQTRNGSGSQGAGQSSHSGCGFTAFPGRDIAPQGAGNTASIDEPSSFNVSLIFQHISHQIKTVHRICRVLTHFFSQAYPKEGSEEFVVVENWK